MLKINIKLCCLCICLFFISCQLSTANYLRDYVFPQETTTKILLSPVLLPTYMIVGVGDIIVVNPARGALHVPKVSKAIWKWGNDDPWLGYGLFMPVKIIGIPGAALGTVMFSEQFIYDNK